MPIDLPTDLPTEWTPTGFHWHTYDLAASLPPGWDAELLRLAADNAVEHTFRPTMSSAREESDVEFRLRSVTGDVLSQRLPWLYSWYDGWIRSLGERYCREPLHPTSTVNRALSLNIMRGSALGEGTADRYPCHVDSNPVQGLLYLTDCTADTGGGLVIARNPAARTVVDVDADCLVLYPQRGQLHFFDAREHAHYVQPMHQRDSLRAVITMNYYSQSCPESVRPAGLDAQLFAEADRA